MDYITGLFNHFGYIVLFVALTLELIAVPTPGETLMMYCGFLVFQGSLNWVLSILVAVLGVICGITISYFIGHALGASFFKKYGSYIHMGPEKMEKTSKWFERYGNGLLIIAYFIPGVRHVTGYFSGITKIPYKRFALNAYIGAFIWTSTFILLGKTLGSNWERFHFSIKKYLIIGGIILALGLIVIYIYKRYKEQVTDFTIKSLENSINIFHSLGRIKVAIIAVAVVFTGLSLFVAGLIQDFLAHEFSQFDDIVNYLMRLIFDRSWFAFMKLFQFSTYSGVLIILTLLTFAWIMIKGRNQFLEVRFLIIVILGGELLEEVLRLIFHRLSPWGINALTDIKYTFPSEQTLMVVVAYGFATYMIIRYIKKKWIVTALLLTTLFICFSTGLSTLYFQTQYPSDILAGYAFGGVWLSLNIILLEIFRIMPKLKM